MGHLSITTRTIHIDGLLAAREILKEVKEDLWAINTDTEYTGERGDIR